MTARSRRRSRRPALLFGPALLITCIASSREARNAGRKPATSAPRTARPSPDARTGQTAVTASSRGMAGPAISLKTLMIPNARAGTERAAEQGDQQALDRDLTKEREPSDAERACGPRTRPDAGGRARAAGRRRCRTRSAAPALPRRTAAAECVRASRLKFVGERLWPARVIPSKSLSACACLAVSTVSSARAWSMVAPLRSRPTTSQFGCFSRSGFGAAGIQKSTCALTL